ncbi:hypothetical protein A3D05_05970 [Candidatus Gottesmanbacteria bacterium RIFCSPHIGHO2_02_FULL_40_24]|uniref:Uncharacterized protein n=1 Tax=Candidatus Gottesmanbacteria bacterium RIFCSPHIGHO2_01_FULL_40_15 TaxID=1798376 RepID=A0A1F5Z7E2_9BACT|nr:MAG: hypothetical protein A2777_02890 [Candidatus Gottesmanbacteria bacterium RIFCSPHIGHO2_01_FULL_40_15]OGG16786.1 MAG: hypothetical protein A3D05_05970 [Candidatus Gottesmanbacteria bacterium RIFCSPHIGHO2_02_FULL_40_24]OGG23107.1 MAG: hypothetical protein A3E42_04065 [Candidatus Gottesmanbacteria bacterium RIFCSPHIGHO2_12_FULL_40_13]OGG23253.1 MAG: hypothetical protein A3B48_00585 [Candidatus Gottesmanbacteria bacterium RIFCSPLOWO2_01_FULL_40_10]OGG33108.1 MAG: hypothetical protein A3I80_0
MLFGLIPLTVGYNAFTGSLLNRNYTPFFIAFLTKGVLSDTGILLNANIVLTAPHAQGSLLFAPQANPGPHL